MLGYKSARIRELEAELAETEKRAKILADMLDRCPMLTGIRNNGRELILRFRKGNDSFEYVTYSTMESDTNGLKKWANIT